MGEQIKKISEKTLVPISMVITLFGGVAWLTNLYAENKSHGSEIREIKQMQTRYDEKLDRVIEKLNRIEGYLRRK